MLTLTAVTFAWMYMRVGSSWYLLAYYPAKFLVTGMLPIIPLGAVGLGTVVAAAWGVAGASVSPVVGRTVVLGVAGVALIGAAGWATASQPRLWVIGTSGLGLPPFNLAMEEALADRDVPRDTGAIVFGLVPDAAVGDIIGGAAVVDAVAMETLGIAGFDTRIGDGAKAYVAGRKWDQLCLWLRDNPQGVVITGPNPESGLPWMRDYGCREDWVRPQRWVSVPIADEWLTGLQVATREFQYPSYRQFVDFMDPAAVSA